MITHLGAYPSLAIGSMLDSHQHDVGTILRESLETEGQALALYKHLLMLVEGHSVRLEEYARQDGPRGGTARRRGEQDAPPTGRGRRVHPAPRNLSDAAGAGGTSPASRLIGTLRKQTVSAGGGVRWQQMKPCGRGPRSDCRSPVPQPPTAAGGCRGSAR